MNKSIWKILIVGFLVLFLLTSCNCEPWSCEVSVSNTMELNRDAETVEVWLDQLEGFTRKNARSLKVIDASGKRLLTQLIDVDQDSLFDYLVFQVDVKARETRSFMVVQDTEAPEGASIQESAFCCFVPERIDDFAWENDRVAFRTYGPECQRLIEAGDPAGLISSGIDCWLKRVSYPIINKWYAKSGQGKSYHVDDGEGLDNYHVGTSRGCGGTAIVINGEYVLSENFKDWRVIANGPIRSIFELDYPAHIGDKYTGDEKKTFTIDLGSNLFQCDVKYSGEKVVDCVAIGITHHNKAGVVLFQDEEGWLTFWETMDDSFLGTAIVIDSSTGPDSELSAKKDAENNWVTLSIQPNAFRFWSGFGWKKSGQFSSSEEWNSYIAQQAKLKNNPLLVSVVKPR